MGRRVQPGRRRGPPPGLAKAMALWQNRKFDEALRSFGKAVRESPNDPGVLIDAARALGARYQIDRSIALLGKALRLGSRRVDVQQAVGESYRMLGRMKEAEACFRSACRLGPTAESELALAQICERRHALDEADNFVTRVLRTTPRSAAGLLLRARIERRRNEYDKARATLQQLITIATDQPKTCAEAYGELSILLDATGEYDAAWAAILECKQIQLSHEQSSWTAAQFVLARASKMIDALTAEHFARWQSAGSTESEHRLALLTGFPRSGTTLLEQILDAHPDIVATEERDIFSAEVFPRFGEGLSPDSPIDQILDRLSPRQIDEARQLYMADIQAILGEPIGSRVHLDKNPAMNLMIPPMKRVFPKLKLLVALRDPRDVVVSCFLRYLPINPVSVCFLTLERTVDRYVLDIGAWRKLRDLLSDWTEIRYEDIVADVGRESKRALDAFGVAWDDSILQYRARHTQKPVNSPSYDEVARPIFTSSIGRWQNYERHLQPVLDRLAPLVSALGYSR